MFWSWSKTLHNMGRIYSCYVSGSTIKIKIHEYGDFSYTHKWLFKELSWHQFCNISYPWINNNQVSLCHVEFLLVLFGVSIPLVDFGRPFSSRYFGKLGFLFAVKKLFCLCKFEGTIIIIRHYRSSKINQSCFSFSSFNLFFFLFDQHHLNMFVILS